jgi:thiamine biosynthesis lipoprotein
LIIVARHARAMGSAIEVQIALDDPAAVPAAEAAADAALAWIAEAEARLSRFIPASELCALNRAAGTPFRASEDLFAIVAEALAWSARTDGLFDPTLLTTLEAWGYDVSFERHAPPPDPLPITDGEGEIVRAEISVAERAQPQLRSPLSISDGEGPGVGPRLDPVTRTITLPAGVGIDLGGIGKGWAADAVLARVLGAHPHALVNIGGDLAVRGGPEGGWIIGARDPRHEGAAEPVYLGGVRLRAGGIATSGAAWRCWRIDGVPAHHLIDPRTGRPATTVGIAPTEGLPLAVTALARSATEAEVRAKEALLLGLPAGLARLDGGTERAGWFIMGDGRILPSANLQVYLAAQRKPEPGL